MLLFCTVEKNRFFYEHPLKIVIPGTVRVLVFTVSSRVSYTTYFLILIKSTHFINDNSLSYIIILKNCRDDNDNNTTLLCIL